MLCAALAGPALAQSDTALFTSNVPPNVMLLIDSSGSMGTSLPSGGTRMSAAKAAAIQLIDRVNPTQPDGTVVQNVRFGLAKFNGGVGATVLQPVGTSKSALVTSINGIFASGNTPLSEALLDLGRYLAGEHRLEPFATMSGVTSPIDAVCRQTFIVILTDGLPCEDRNFLWTSTMGAQADQDGDGIDPTGSASNNCGTTLPNYSHWLDDVAKFLYETDIVPDTLMSGRQSIATYTVGFTLDHPLLERTADENHGRGRYYTTSEADVLAAQLADALQDIIERSQSLASATVPSSRTAFGDAFFTSFFVPSITDPFWAGHVQAYRLDSNLDVIDSLGRVAIDPVTNLFLEPRAPFWDAADRLVDPAHPARSLFTTDVSGTPARGDFATYVTQATLDLQSTDLSKLPPNPDTGVTYTAGELADAAADLEAYLQGFDAFDQDGDTDTAELRDFVLGDNFHSSPILIGPPPAALIAEEGYGPITDSSSFLAMHRDRERRLFFGTNGGFLHALDAGSFQFGDNPLTTSEVENGYFSMGTGNEVFAWTPGSLVDQLKYIPSPTDNLPRTHYYVDGSPNAADVWFPSSAADTSKSAAEWRTVLVTGMRQGGSGYLALDITDPSDADYPELLWEVYNDPADARAFTNVDFGETWSDPIITRVKLDAGASLGDHCGPDDNDDGDCRERWVMIVGGGYTASGDPNLPGYAGPASAGWTTAGKGVYMIAMDTGEVIAQLTYIAGDATFQNMKYAIPSAPAVLDLDFDGFADLVYIGDLGGQVWKWDIHEKGADADSDGLIDNWPGGVFFRKAATAVPGGLHYHSIFFPPVATYLDDELYLAFASGERTSLGYPGVSTADDNNRIWVARDRHPTGSQAFSYIVHEGNVTVGGLLRGLSLVATSDATDPVSGDDGYYLVVPDGQKFITNHIVFAGLFLTLAYEPDLSVGGDICAKTGKTILFAFELDNARGLLDASISPDGTARTLTLGNGAPTDPKISVSTNSDGETVVQLIGQTSLGEIAKIPVPAKTQGPVELIYWRQRH
jgi:type IV pilus assembly protein PilY1